MKILKICLVISVLFVIQHSLVAADNENTEKAYLETYYNKLKQAIKHGKEKEATELLNEERTIQDQFNPSLISTQKTLICLGWNTRGLLCLLAVDKLPALAQHFDVVAKNAALSKAANKHNHKACKTLVEDHGCKVNKWHILSTKRQPSKNAEKPELDAELRDYLLSKATNTVKFEYALHLDDMSAIEELIKNSTDIELNEEAQQAFVDVCFRHKKADVLIKAKAKKIQISLEGRSAIHDLSADDFKWLLENKFFEINNHLATTVARYRADLFATLVNADKTLGNKLTLNYKFISSLGKGQEELLKRCTPEQQHTIFREALQKDSYDVLEALEKIGFKRDDNEKNAILALIYKKPALIRFLTEDEIREAIGFYIIQDPDIETVKKLADSKKIDFSQPIRSCGNDLYTWLDDKTDKTPKQKEIFNLLKQKGLKQGPDEMKKRLQNQSFSASTTPSMNTANTNNQHITNKDPERPYLLIAGGLTATGIIVVAAYYFRSRKPDKTEKTCFDHNNSIATH